MKGYHLGFIPDGNRRWAKQNEVDYYTSYLIGMKKLLSIFNYAFDNLFKEISVYFLSTENLKRTKDDLNAVINSQIEFIVNDLIIYQRKAKCNIRVVGNISLLPINYQNAISLFPQWNKNFNRTINLLIAYNPYHELFEAFSSNTISSEADIREYLKINTPVDLVIRTAGGKCPLSNFLPLQCGYAFSNITETHLNDLDQSEIKGIFDEFFFLNPKFGQ